MLGGYCDGVCLLEGSREGACWLGSHDGRTPVMMADELFTVGADSCVMMYARQTKTETREYTRTIPSSLGAVFEANYTSV